MLILSRRQGESIKIGDEVTVTILQARGGQVKIGINAPREVAVHREEVYLRLADDLPKSCAPAPGKPSTADRETATSTAKELA